MYNRIILSFCVHELCICPGDLQGEITDNCPTIYMARGYVPVYCCPMLACPHTNGYARAKLANILHAFELQRRIDTLSGSASKKRRVVVSSLHPGAVSSEIHPFLKHPLIKPLLRSPLQAANVVLRGVFGDDFVPSSYFDAMGLAHDFFVSFSFSFTCQTCSPGFYLGLPIKIFAASSGCLSRDFPATTV